MLKEITLGFTETGKINFPAPGVTIFVGPNNSGKSLVLREIERIFSESRHDDDRILAGFEIHFPTEEELTATFSRTGGKQILLRVVHPSAGIDEYGVDLEDARYNVHVRPNKKWVAGVLFRSGCLRLDGRSRFNLTNDQEGGDLLQDAKNTLGALFKNGKARTEVRRLIHEAFGLYFVIDPSLLGHLRIRLSSTEPGSDEQSLSERALKYYSEAIHIRDASDGVQAFTGIVTAVQSADYHTLLIDEPEAFLHPPLARKLGMDLAKLVNERSASLMASTHSADFLMGCVQASTAVRVIRLEYSQGKSRGRMIDPEALRSFLKRPLMRSANVVSGLFHDGVIVVESDNDRAFYSEIYHRMSQVMPRAPSILFLNAQSKQTIKEIIGPLRQFGVPAAAIPDIDIVKDGGKTWTDWLTSAQVPTGLHLGFGQQRSSIKAALEATGKDMKADGGLDLLRGEDLRAAEELFDSLERYGIFPLRGGELEHWLPHLGVIGKGTHWTVAMLERLGDDPNSPSYINPSTDDVWAHLQKVVEWIGNASRKGMS